MFFILQDDKEFNKMDVDMLVLKQELQKQRMLHEYTTQSIHYFDADVHYSSKINMKEAVPVGSIDFVGQYLKQIHGIDNMNPIEVPNELRMDKFLWRDYRIVGVDELPQKGYYFIKDVSQLKQFTYTGEVSYLFYNGVFDEPKRFDTRLHLNPNHLFEVSEVVNILSEYRVFISEDKIKGIQFYDGDPTIMPTPDEINKLQEAVIRYSVNPTRPRAYALDIAVIKTKTDIGRDLMIIESCPFASLGLYGLVGSFLPYMYRDGIDWYIKHNTKIQKYRNTK